MLRRRAASTRQRRTQVARRLRARSPGAGSWRRSAGWRSRSPASASCTSRRRRSAAAWRRSSTRSSRSCATSGSRPSGGSSTARTSSSTSPRRSTTRSRANPQTLDEEQRRIFEQYNRRTPKRSRATFDFVIVHDPQPAAMSSTTPSRGSTGSGAATSTSRRRTATCSTSCARRSRATTRRSSTGGSTSAGHRAAAGVHLAAGHRSARAEEHGALRRGCRLHRRPVRDRRERPLVTQVSRFDPWKDPLGVIEAWRLLREHHPDVQLALVGSMAHDDPEGWEYYNQTVAAAEGHPDIYILSNLNNVGSVEVNAFQVHSAALIQKSVREGFGLTVTEGALEGTSDGGRQGRRHRRPDPGRRDGISRRRCTGLRPGAPEDPRRPCRTPARWRSRARNTSG